MKRALIDIYYAEFTIFQTQLSFKATDQLSNQV